MAKRTYIRTNKVVRLTKKVKPVFHQKPCFLLGNFRIANAEKMHKQHEIKMANVNLSLMSPTQTIFHWLVLGLALGQRGFTLGQQGFLDTNMLVSVT